MAAVYRATDEKLARTVAVKVILPSHASDARFIERFMREARVVAKLEHPHILPVYDFGEENGVPFLVMPYLEGGSLRDRMVGTPIPLVQAAIWIRQLADALDAAHAAGVLHRDVKPANVLIGKGERLALADFGIARLMESASGLTATGVVVGTPIYMAPEQAQGLPVTPASDRYTLAVLAFELISGRPPFDGESALALLHQHVTTPAPALSTKVGGLPAGLDAVFAKALSKDPAERPATCRALADQIALFCPSGTHGVVEPSTAPWASSSSPSTSTPPGIAAPSAVRGPATPPLSVATPPPTNLTGAVTVATRAESKESGRWRNVAILVTIAAGALFLVLRPDQSRLRPLSGPVAVHATPTAASSALQPPATTPTAGSAPRAAPREQPKIIPPAGVAAPPPPPPPAPPDVASPDLTVEPAGEETSEGSLAEARARVDPAKHPGHRPDRADFEFVERSASTVLEKHPEKPEAKYLSTWARGGLDYLDRKDASAGQALVLAFEALRKRGFPEARTIGLLLRQPGGAIAAPSGWKLALAYQDARGEAESLLEKALRDSPGDFQPLFGRAHLRHLQGGEKDAIADATKAYDAAPAPAASAVAEFLGDSCVRDHRFEEGLTWYRAALKLPGPWVGPVALKAAKLCKNRLKRPDDAAELYRISCRAGNPEACRETGGEPERRPPRGPLRKRFVNR